MHAQPAPDVLEGVEGQRGIDQGRVAADPVVGGDAVGQEAQQRRAGAGQVDAAEDQVAERRVGEDVAQQEADALPRVQVADVGFLVVTLVAFHAR